MGVSCGRSLTARLATHTKTWWARDGQLSCVAWLVWRTNMARSTAFEDFAAAFQAFLDRRYRPQPVDQSSAEDTPTASGEAPIDQPSRSATKANAFMDLVRTALAHADGGRAAGADRYLVHLVTRDDRRRLSQLDGTACSTTAAKSTATPTGSCALPRPDGSYLGITHPAPARMLSTTPSTTRASPASILLW